MCGICGFVGSGDSPAGAPLLWRMVGALRHRGPDAAGLYAEGPVGLGHARLSIIDLTGGNQPMQTTDGSLAIVFNGEIFNYVELRNELISKGHRFATQSDTEVILHSYEEEGDKCVERFNGQWAFAMWDRRRQRLLLSRDRFGVRPLFYTQGGDRFLFASEIKALLACPDVEFQLDLPALDQVFTFWVTLPPRTAFRNIQQVPPGHTLVLEDGHTRLHSYWRLNFAPEEEPEGSEPRLAEELCGLLEDATRIRLRADVPVGSYLSGGLDSTLITALANGLAGDRLRTFSLSFADAEFDERPYQQEAAAFLGTRHTELRCTGDDIAEVFPEVVWHAEQPMLRAAPAPMLLLSRLVRDSGFKVVLTGEGADELLGGYDIYMEAKIRRFCGRMPESALRPLLLKRLYPYMDSIQRQSPTYLRAFFGVNERDLASPFFSHLPRWGLTAGLRTILSEDVRAEVRPGGALAELQRSLPSSFRSLGAFNQAEYLEAAYLLPGYILSAQGDRVAMAHAVEGRHPFLDHRVARFAAKLPPRLKMRVLDAKYLLKRAAEGCVPRSIRNRAKQPYRSPGAQCFLRAKSGYLAEMLSPERIARDGVFDPQTVAALVRKFRSGRSTSARDDMAMMGILSTEILLDRFGARRSLSEYDAARGNDAIEPRATSSPACVSMRA